MSVQERQEEYTHPQDLVDPKKVQMWQQLEAAMSERGASARSRDILYRTLILNEKQTEVANSFGVRKQWVNRLVAKYTKHLGIQKQTEYTI